MNQKAIIASTLFLKGLLIAVVGEDVDSLMLPLVKSGDFPNLYRPLRHISIAPSFIFTILLLAQFTLDFTEPLSSDIY